MKIKSFITAMGMAALLFCGAADASAQHKLPEGTSPMIVVPTNQTISYRERVLCYDVTANVDYEVTADQAWATITKTKDGVFVHLPLNENVTDRVVNIKFSNSEKGISRTLKLLQKGNESASEDNGNYSAEDKAIFKDDLFSGLRDGVTATEIGSMKSNFLRQLATNMYEGKYSTDYRLASYKCHLSVYTQSDRWSAPGKYYDQFAGVTGINIPARTTQIVACKGIPNNVSVQLRVVSWYRGDGQGPSDQSFDLKNGINVVKYNSDFDGLAYVCYYVNDKPEDYPNIDVHFLLGQQNGYLSPDKSNEDMYQICSNAVNKCMDVSGSKVHSVWTAAGLRDYCKASDGVSLGYRQYMNVLDTLVGWEHKLLGFYKYNHIPDNRTMAYVNWTYYMFQGGWGVSFINSQESRVLNCKTLMYNDDDAIWGLSHEWGHQHQMHPYFCWAGMSEVTNNMNSYYNVMHMGYTRSDKITSWPVARKHFVNDEWTSGELARSEHRAKAFRNHGSRYDYSPKLKALCEAQATDSVMTTYAKNPATAPSISDVGVGETLCPFIMLYNYFTEEKGMKDFGPDMYEALRQTDNENGSVIEKSNGIDKYELVASAQNGKTGKYAQLKEKYPESCWITDKYIRESGENWYYNSAPFIMNYIRKVSRLTGYNLLPYFERWGFLRRVAMQIGDYGEKWYLLTPEMYDEFKADMDKLVSDGELKEMPAGMLEEISNAKDYFEYRGHAAGSATTPPAIPN